MRTACSGALTVAFELKTYVQAIFRVCEVVYTKCCCLLKDCVSYCKNVYIVYMGVAYMHSVLIVLETTLTKEVTCSLENYRNILSLVVC